MAYTAIGKTYSFSLSSTATDIAGNALPPKDSSFKVFKQISTTVNSTARLDGRVRSDGEVVTNDGFLYIGDSATVGNATHRSFLSFDLAGLPAALTSANILAANLTVNQYAVAGNPYTDLDVAASDLMLDHVNYGTSLTAADFDPTVYSNQGDISRSTALGNYTKSVLSALKDDRTNSRVHSQYRLRFAKLIDGDGNANIAYLRSGDSANDKPSLVVAYLIP